MIYEWKKLYVFEGDERSTRRARLGIAGLQNWTPLPLPQFLRNDILLLKTSQLIPSRYNNLQVLLTKHRSQDKNHGSFI